jgi:hypothetical protein
MWWVLLWWQQALGLLGLRCTISPGTVRTTLGKSYHWVPNIYMDCHLQ